MICGQMVAVGVGRVRRLWMRGTLLPTSTDTTCSASETWSRDLKKQPWLRSGQAGLTKSRLIELMHTVNALDLVQTHRNGPADGLQLTAWLRQVQGDHDHWQEQLICLAHVRIQDSCSAHALLVGSVLKHILVPETCSEACAAHLQGVDEVRQAQLVHLALDVRAYEPRKSLAAQQVKADTRYEHVGRVLHWQGL